MIFLRSLFFYIAFTVLIIGLIIAILINKILFANNQSKLDNIIAKGAYILEMIFKYITNIHMNVIGLENLPKQFIIASKHQSALETVIFFRIFFRPSFVMKHELALIPFVGQFLKLINMIFIDRGNGFSAMKKIITISRQRLKQGYNIVIFPEGTRVRPNQTVPYNPGIYMLYKDNIADIVPVGLDTGRLWPKNSFLKYPGSFTIKIGKPIPPNKDKAEFMQQLRHDIEELSTTV